MEDQTMQTILRFGLDEGGALVFVHTAALREELSMTADGAVVTAHGDRALGECSRCPRGDASSLRQQTSFTVSDILDDPAVDCSRRSVQRVLKEFTELGYLDRHNPGVGQANTFTTIANLGLGETSLPTVDGLPENEGDVTLSLDGSHSRVYYTGCVGIRDDDGSSVRHRPADTVILPAPEEGAAGLPLG